VINTGENLWAWVAEEKDGSISTIAVHDPQYGGWLPLIARSEEAVREMGKEAVIHGLTHGLKIWMRKYQLVEEIGR